ncbi:MAG: cyclic pyranopterin monophosphate synthase MoaC [Ignavibacteriales bacterium]
MDFNKGEGVISTPVEVRTVWKIGIEMESNTWVSSTLLTILDMIKSAEKEKSGYCHILQ